MNREQRRSKGRQISEELQYLNTPCTITEAAQIARGVAEDVLADYQNHVGYAQVAMSIQVEVIKEILFSSGLVTEDKFKEEYIKRAEEFNKLQKSVLNVTEEDAKEETSPRVEVKPNDIEVRKV